VTAECPYTLQWAPISPIAPSHGGSGPHLTHDFFGISIGSAVFAQMTAECPYTLQWDDPFPLKIVPSHGGIWTPSNTWFRGPTQVLNPNGILIGSVVLAGLTSVTDRPTDHATRSVTIDRIYVRSTVMRSNNVIPTAYVISIMVKANDIYIMYCLKLQAALKIIFSQYL